MNTSTSHTRILNQIKTGIVLFFFVFAAAPQLFGQADLDSLFKSDDLLSIELHADFKAILDTRWSDDSIKGGETEYYEAKILYGNEGNQVEVPLRIKARGQFRRNPKYCKFPP